MNANSNDALRQKSAKLIAEVNKMKVYLDAQEHLVEFLSKMKQQPDKKHILEGAKMFNSSIVLAHKNLHMYQNVTISKSLAKVLQDSQLACDLLKIECVGTSKTCNAEFTKPTTANGLNKDFGR